MRIVIIGGGVIGTVTAYFLAQDGNEVVLVDRAESLAAEGSFSNGGMLHASHTEPWNTPAAVGQLLRWIGREDSPLLLRPSQLPKLMGWGLNFLRYSRSHHHERNTRVNARLAVYSQQVMRELRETAGFGYDDAQQGILKIFRSAEELSEAGHASRLIEDLGVRFETLDADGVIAREPALADIRDVLAGGIFYPADETGDACLFSRRLGELAERAGAELRLGETVHRLEGNAAGVTRVVTDRGALRGDRYVLAAGADAPLLTRRLGLRLPIQPVKGYSATLDVTDLPGVPTLPIIDEGHKVVLSRLGQRLRVAGMAEFAGYDRRIQTHRAQTIVAQALDNLPTLAQAVDTASAEHWACLRPMTVDGPPILGPSPVANLFLNAGAGHLGWTFAAGAGRVVADVVGGRRPAIDLDGLTVERYGR